MGGGQSTCISEDEPVMDIIHQSNSQITSQSSKSIPSYPIETKIMKRTATGEGARRTSLSNVPSELVYCIFSYIGDITGMSSVSQFWMQLLKVRWISDNLGLGASSECQPRFEGYLSFDKSHNKEADSYYRPLAFCNGKVREIIGLKDDQLLLYCRESGSVFSFKERLRSSKAEAMTNQTRVENIVRSGIVMNCYRMSIFGAVYNKLCNTVYRFSFSKGFRDEEEPNNKTLVVDLRVRDSPLATWVDERGVWVLHRCPVCLLSKRAPYSGSTTGLVWVMNKSGKGHKAVELRHCKLASEAAGGYGFTHGIAHEDGKIYVSCKTSIYTFEKGVLRRSISIERSKRVRNLATAQFVFHKGRVLSIISIDELLTIWITATDSLVYEITTGWTRRNSNRPCEDLTSRFIVNDEKLMVFCWNGECVPDGQCAVFSKFSLSLHFDVILLPTLCTKRCIVFPLL